MKVRKVKKGKIKRNRKRSQPRNPGKTREPKASCFPHEVTIGLNQIAWRERKSVSWVIATIIYDYFGLDETGYISKSERKRA
jgi:hypothetical protein